MNGNDSVSFGNEKNMKGGGRDVLRSVWYGMEWHFFGRKGGAKGICVGWELCMHVSFPFPFFGGAWMM
jgi:hypothetical protein